MAKYVNPDVNENDWRLFRELFPIWRDRYMEKLFEKYIDLLRGEGDPVDRFHKLEKMMEKEYYKACFLVEMSRSKLWTNIVSLLRDGVITEEDIAPFSIELREKVTFVMTGLRKNKMVK